MSRILYRWGWLRWSNLVSRLINEKHEVIVLDDPPLALRSCIQKCSFYAGSITNEDTLSECFLKPDYVVHMAALFANQNSVDHPLDDLKVNGESTVKVLQYSKAYGVQKLLYTSSCVYGNGST